MVESGDVCSGEVVIGIFPNVGLFFEPRVMLESTDEIDVCLLRPDLWGRDGPFGSPEFVGVEGRTERPISRGFVG